MERFYINIRVPVDNADRQGAMHVCDEMLSSNHGGEIGLVADEVWITDENGATVGIWKGPH